MQTQTADKNGLGAVARQVAEHASSLFRLELELAQLEVKKKVTSLGLGIGLAIGAAVFAFYGLGFLFATIAAGLATAMSTWLAILIVTCGLFLVGAILGLIASTGSRRERRPSRSRRSSKRSSRRRRSSPMATSTNHRTPDQVRHEIETERDAARRRRRPPPRRDPRGDGHRSEAAREAARDHRGSARGRLRHRRRDRRDDAADRPAPLTAPGAERLSARDWLAVFKSSGKEFLADDCMGLSQQVAYSSLLAFFPAMIFLIAFLDLIGAYGALIDFLDPVAPKSVTSIDPPARARHRQRLGRASSPSASSARSGPGAER